MCERTCFDISYSNELSLNIFFFKLINGKIKWHPIISKTIKKENRIGSSTEYVIALLPLGGYVKMAGMIDESMDKEQMSKPPQPWEFRSKPAWQRLVVMLGGIIFNVITGLIIFTMITFNNGETYLSKDEINKNGILALELGLEAGFKTGDKILLINDKEWERDAELFDPNLFFDDKFLINL